MYYYRIRSYIYCEDIRAIRISLIQMVRQLCRGKKAEMVTMLTQEFMILEGSQVRVLCSMIL